MDQEECFVKIEENNFSRDEVDSSILDNNEDLKFIDFHKDAFNFSCVNSYDISSSSLIKSPLVSELLISHGLLGNRHVEERPLCDPDAESKFCSIDDSYGPPSFLQVYSLQPPPINWIKVEDEKGDYKCGWESCDMHFSYRKDLAQHINSSHICKDENSLYRCHWSGFSRQGKEINPSTFHVCGKKFSRVENLRIHIRSHTGEKPYACPVPGCNKAYSNSSDRFKHSKTHEEDKPYVCRVEGCDKRYTDPSSLRKHMKSTAHGGENHQKIHSQGSKNGDIQMETSVIANDGLACSQLKSTNSKISIANKPYACKVEGCNKRYTDPSSLRKHQRATSHGRDPNSLKLKISVSKTMQNKKNILNSQVSNGAITKVTKINELSDVSDNSTKDSNLFKVSKVEEHGKKCSLDDPKPLDLSTSCTLVENSSIGSHTTFELKQLNS